MNHEHADAGRAGPALPAGPAHADRAALRRWLALHAALALLCVAGLYAAGRSASTAGQDIGDPALRAELATARPDVVLLGNSMLKDGVNADLLDELLRGEAPGDAAGGATPGAADASAAAAAPRTFKHALGGVYSAYWYLYLKNCVIPAGPPPLVVIPFRDPILTFATFRTAGSYAANIARVSLPEEPEVARVFALNAAGGGDVGDRALAALRRGLPVYAERDRLRDALFESLKALPAETARGALPSYASAVSAVLPVRAFAAAEDGGEEPGALENGADIAANTGANAVASAGSGTGPDAGNPFGALDGTPASAVFDTLDYLRFERVVDASLLPAIVDLCRAHGIRLALLRLHKGPSPDWSDMVPADLLAAYEQACNRWLAEHGVILLDTTRDAALGEGAFRGPDHLNEIGREHLTLVLAQWLRAWWAMRGASADVPARLPGAVPADASPGASTRVPADASAEALARRFLDIVARGDSAAARTTVQEWPIPVAEIEPVRRAMFRVVLPAHIAADGDTEAEPERSRWELFEDGRPLGPPHTALPTIVKFGAGRYAHDGAELFFSASDDSSPRDNGRRYVLRKRALTLEPGP